MILINEVQHLGALRGGPQDTGVPGESTLPCFILFGVALEPILVEPKGKKKALPTVDRQKASPFYLIDSS